MKKDKLNNFQRQETARWLLNISQAVIVGGPGSLFVPGVSERVGLLGATIAVVLALVLYILAMLYGREGKNVN